MKLIGLDVGTRRIGVAKADTSVRIAVPDGAIMVTGQEMVEIAKLAKRYNTTWFVIGLPRNSRGQETQQSAYVRDFAVRLKQVIPAAKIRFQDESLTSVEAEARLQNRKRGYQKGDIDAEAATIILQDFIENFSTSQASASYSDEPNVDLADKNDGSDSLDRNPYARDDLLDNIDGAAMKKHKSKKSRKSFTKFLVIFLIALVALGGGAVLWYNINISPIYAVPACSGEDDRCKEISFSVSERETAAQIASNLESAGLIKSKIAFQIYLRLNPKNADGEEIKMKQGDYQLRRTMSVAEIIKQLDEGSASSNVFRVTILPGETIKQIKTKLVSEYGYSEEEVNAAFVKDYSSHPVLKGRDLEKIALYGAEPLEGYIFGDTYEFYVGETVEKVITTALDHLWEKIEGNNLETRFANHGLTLAQGITLASIVQKEAATLDQPTVARVFLNRISLGMTLGSDVTAKYAVDLADPNRERYTDNAAVLAFDSEYNTRLYAGLTPGPICNPGISALLAVADPTDTDALFFLTGDDGVMYYSNTDEGHQANIRDRCQVLCNVDL